MNRLAVALVVVLLGVGIFALRETTMSVHTDIPPGADEPDRAQLRGCLEDLRVRHLRLNVLGEHMVVQGETTVRTGRTP